ncbi:multiple sugar transport system substrate-binding protein [Catalinimonas alkaloidigena]|uniref:Multiple sugar transport system substrate-binding protein n=2 Tax=Catalinimonas alkaloidigena TaxID=1075417 RepID=A0A1G9E8K3_9BACT|nr:multiple sugar transport system substrate-binding protein [Catalinimonas alkaloidigena]
MRTVATLGFAGVLLGGCHDDERAARTLRYWSSNNSQEIAFADRMVQAWNATHPDQPVAFQPVPEGQSSEEIILAAVVGGTTPDIYSNMWQGDVERYARAGRLVPLDTLRGFRDYLRARCDSAVIREITSDDGHIYQIPWKVNPIVMIYNQTIVDTLARRAPQTYAEFLAAAQRFHQDRDGDGYVDQWFGYSEPQVTWWQRFFDFYPLYLAASGGAPLIEHNRAVFDNEHAVAVFAFLQALYQQQYFPRERLSARQDPFLANVIATRFTGPWEISHADQFKPEGFQYAFAEMPAPAGAPEPHFTYGDPKNMVIFNTCTRPQDALDFLMFATNAENDLALLELTSQLPRRKALLQHDLFAPFFEAHPKMVFFARQAAYVRGTDNSEVMKEVFDLISQEYEACVIYGQKTPEEAVHDAAQAVNLLFTQ